MSKRKSISQKIRFEVFKRDSFTCQYCGRKAPDVLLQVDHIKPVAKGGKNDVINLITSCFDCNSGKSDRELSDDSVVEKQRKQLEQLEERRQQLEMLMQWHVGLNDLQDDQVQKYTDYFNKVNNCNVSLSDYGKKNAKKYIDKYGFKNVLEAIDVVATKYSDLEVEDKLKKIGGILAYSSASESDKQAMYIKGVCRNRFAYFDYKYGAQLIKSVLQHFQYEFVLQIAKDARNWSKWRNRMEELLNDVDEPDDEPF